MAGPDGGYGGEGAGMKADNLYGLDLFGEPIRPPTLGPLADRFTFPPFSVLDGRREAWKARKRRWLALGIQSELGRDAVSLATSGWLADVDNKGARTDFAHGWKAGGTSVFDPVLAELICRWYSASGDQVVDPFAGGSVRGIVTAALGRRYWGCDLRPEQVRSNQEQAAAIDVDAVWVAGDSRSVLSTSPMADLLMSCPPYGDLEVYSDDPADLSNMTHEAFTAAHSEIIARALARLRDDRFAVWVVGDFRCKDGWLRDFTGETVRAFEGAGARLYDRAVLLTPTGTLAVRAGRQFSASRKLGRGHQVVLVFCKGSATKAARRLGDL